MKKKVFLLTIAISISIMMCGAFMINSRSESFNTIATQNAYGISFDSSKNKLHYHYDDAYYNGNATIQTNLGNNIGFDYYQIKGLASTWHVLGGGGYFYNTDPIHGIELIDLSFKTDGASYTIYYSRDNSFDQHVDFVSSTSSHKTFNFNGCLPNYIKILNNTSSDFNLASIDITLNCLNNYKNLSVSSENETMGTVSGGGVKISGENVTITANPNPGYCFVGWYSGETLVSSDATYNFIMGQNDLTYIARFISQENWNKLYGITPSISQDGTTMTYGLYPQIRVDDSLLISSLNALLTPESNGWYLYNGAYYAKVNATPFNNAKFIDGTVIESGETYWFKCELITWKILSNSNGNYYIVSSDILDVHEYFNTTTGTRLIDGKRISPNNYKYSDIRTWLNEDFYNTAFALGNSYIQTTTVDNSAATTDSKYNKYYCANTEDKVFFPSYQDYANTTYFPTQQSRRGKTTDWARARGSYYYKYSEELSLYGVCYTRSPYIDSSGSAWTVDYTGHYQYSEVNTTAGVRPGLSIYIA